MRRLIFASVFFAASISAQIVHLNSGDAVEGSHVTLNGNFDYLTTTARNPLAYSGGTTYAKGQAVSSAGVVYLSLQDGNAANTPASSPSFWAAIAAAPIGFTPEPAISAGVSTQYWRGDKTWQALNTAVVAAMAGLYQSPISGAPGTWPSTFAPSAHAASHKHGGADEVATATAAADAIPKAGAGGTLAVGWFPTLNQNTTGTAANVTGIVAEANGGTGANNTTGAAGHYLRSNGTHYLDSSVQVADVPTLNQNTSGNAATATALAATPSLCTTGQAPTGVLANGNATGCAAISGGGVTLNSGTGITITGTNPYTVNINAAVTATREQVVIGVDRYIASASASGTTYTGCPTSNTPAGNSINSGDLVAGLTIEWKPDLNGTGGATTLNPCAAAAVPIKENDGSTNPTNTDIVAGRIYKLVHDGTNFRLPAVTTGGGSTTANWTVNGPGNWWVFGMNYSTRAALPQSGAVSCWEQTPPYTMPAGQAEYTYGSPGAGASMSFAIYNALTGALVVSTAGIPMSSGTAFQATAFAPSSTSLTGGTPYYFCLSSDATATTYTIGLVNDAGAWGFFGNIGGSIRSFTASTSVSWTSHVPTWTGTLGTQTATTAIGDPPVLTIAK